MQKTEWAQDIPKLGFGLMRLPGTQGGGKVDLDAVTQMVDAFMAAGLRYFDTAYVYDKGGSEETVKTVLVDRYPRESFMLASKLHATIGVNSAAEAKRELEISLERTGAGYFDCYLLHSLMLTNYKKYDEYGLWDFVKAQKAAGKIRHIGFSFHGTPDLLEKLLTDHPEAEFVQLQINYADWDNPAVASRKCYDIARAHNKPVIVMEPVKGGFLADPPAQVKTLLTEANPDASPASWAIRFAASLPGVVTVLSGMSDTAQMQDNLSYMADFKPLNEGEQQVIVRAQAVIAGLDSIACTGCRYCVAGCPKHIRIPDIFSAMNRHLMYGQTDNARSYYAKAVAGNGKASDCIACGQCEKACPQHLPIINLLKDCTKVLEVK
jgi:predicted aldo/keto reductase-like oxidoreductase